MLTSRVPFIDADALDPEDRPIYDAIAGPRGGLGGPFAAWFAVPEIAGLVNQLVDRLRFKSTLDKRIYELATLLVAAHWSADFIWKAHAKAALAAGLSAAAVEAIRRKEPPVLEAPDEQACYDLIVALIDTRAVPVDVFAVARDVFGVDGVVELVTVAGYYSMNAMIVTTFAIVPETPV